MTETVITLFGPPRVEVNGEQVEISRRKALALIAYMAVTAQRHSRDALAALLWPEATTRRARGSLRSALWALNKTPLEALLVVEAEAVALRSDAAVAVDVTRFRTLMAASQSHEHPSSAVCAACVDSVSTAVALYQNDFMAGFTLPDAPAFDEWQFFQSSELRDLLATALDGLLRFFSAAGDFSAAIAYARRFTALDPLHEPAHHALMELYARSGQQAAALRQYEIYRESVDSELGIEPTAEMRALRDQIRSGRRPIPETPQPEKIDSPGASVPPHNLPPDPTPLIGREDAIGRVSQLMTDAQKRLVTIVGPGGIGKTRLALAAAGRELSESNFPDGVYFVSLTPVTEPEAMMSLIAETVGYPLQKDRRSPAQQLFDYFRQKSLLLVLDNFEHLLAGAAFIADLLQQAPEVTILTTSRERLNLYEEQQFLLGGLAYPEDQPAIADSDYSAARLFLQSARRRRPDFEVAAADLPHLATICRLVEGMPLGLELAAAWTDVLSLREIADEIRHTLDFLETDVRNVPERHRSMRAVFNASWRRLSERSRSLYAQLAVFRGGFTAAAAQAVADASLKRVAALVSQSLLRAHPEEGRYDVHELLRQYAASKLREIAGGEESVRYRHAAFYCAFLNERAEALKGARQRKALSEIEADDENAIAAWRWAANRQQLAWLEQALVPLALFYQWTGRLREGGAMCRLAVEHIRTQPSSAPENDPRRAHLLLKLLTWESLFELASARYDIAEQLLEQARAIVDDPRLDRRDTTADRAFLLLQLSEAAKIKAFGGDALALNEQSLALYRAIDDDWGVTLALDALGAKHQTLGNYGVAVELAKECLAIHRRLRNPRGIARAYSTLGHYILFAGDIAASERNLRKSLDLFRSMDNRADMRLPLLLLGINLQFGGKFEASIDSCEACWAIHRELGIPHEPGSANVGIARARINLGRYEEARSLSETDLVRYRSLNHKWYIAFTLFNLGRIALVEGDVPQAHDHLQESAAILLEMDDRPLVPDVLFCLALVHRRRGNRSRAIQAMKRALGIALESAPLNPMRFELPAMALLSLDAGDSERAVELYAAARQSPYIARSRWFEEIAGREIARAAADLAPDVAAAAEARGEARDLWSTARALYEELEREESRA